MSDFVKYVHLKKANIICLRGAIPDKAVPDVYIKQELEVEPPELDTKIKDLLYSGNFKQLVDSPFELPAEAHEGEIRVTKQGHLYQGINEMWVMIGSAIARY